MKALLEEKKVTAALFNLIVHVQDIEHAKEVQETTRRMLGKFPCRAIFLTEDPDAKEDYLHQEVATLPMGDVVCEQIFLTFAGKEREKIPLIILPKLLPDLPIYLLWTGDPAPDDVIFPTLEQHTSRIILDPDTLDHLPEYRRFVLMLLRSSFSSVVDLHWSCTEGWRSAIAEAYEDQKLKHVQISYTTCPSEIHEDARMQAAYLQGWLKARLNQEMGVDLIPSPNDSLPLGTLLSVNIETHEGHEFHFDRLKTRIRVQFSTPEKCDLPYTVPLLSSTKSEALEKEIFGKDTSSHYEEMLEKLTWTS